MNGSKLQPHDDEVDNMLDHPVRLRLYLFARNQAEPIGIRQTQRALAINSASTVNWHLDKLVEARYLIKNQDNRYQLNYNHQPKDQITVSVDFTTFLMNDRLVSSFYFVIGFYVMLFLLTIWGWFVLSDPLFIGIQGAVALMVSFMIVLWVHRRIQQEIKTILP